MQKIPNCTAVVLCGGKSTRMGFDKSLLQIEDEFVLLKTAKILQKLFMKNLFVTNEQTKFPASFSGLNIIEDSYPRKGPLGGLVTGLEAIGTEYLFLLACDIPYIDENLIIEMARYLGDNQLVICYHKNRYEPLFAFYHISCLPIFQKQIDSTEDLRIRKEFSNFKLKKISIEDDSVLRNVNTPEELSLWELY